MKTAFQTKVMTSLHNSLSYNRRMGFHNSNWASPFLISGV